jgi:two-component system NtrC family sensor kinase
MGSLGRLVAGIAHELNNPINFVYGNVDFLGQYMDDLLSLVKFIDASSLPPEMRVKFDAMKETIEYDFLVEDSRKLIRSIRAGAERTASIVRDLKTFSRTGGSGELQEADIAAGIDTTLNLIAPLLRGRIKVRRHVSSSLPKLICNAGHINQVFMNILTNAAQAIEGEGSIDVNIEAIDDGKAITVVIADSGPGIPPDVIAKITDPFFTTKDVGEGTGLGLWITENIIRAHGGTMRCESEPGKGATFSITLPVRAPDSARMGIMSAQRSSGAAAVAAARANAKGGGKSLRRVEGEDNA